MLPRKITAVIVAPVIVTAATSTSSKALERQLQERLCRGERVVLYGPRGSGKSTLVERLHRELLSERVPCGRSNSTGHLDDITQALAGAYPEVAAASGTRRAARSKLWVAADHRAGVLLLDQVTKVNNAMVGFLRRLVGGVAGVLLVFDVDSAQERSRLRPGRLGALPIGMPLPLMGPLQALWRRECNRHGIDRPERDVERQLLQAAAGRVGWVVQCAEFARQPRYWDGSRLARANLLQADTEIAVRFGQAALQALNLRTR
jgi:energy-coupling factor transporter ATP-binding protein EcfA2